MATRRSQGSWSRFLHDGSEIQIKPLNKHLTAAYPEVPKHNFILPVVKPDVEMPVIEVQLMGKDEQFEKLGLDP